MTDLLLLCLLGISVYIIGSLLFLAALILGLTALFRLGDRLRWKRRTRRNPVPADGHGRPLTLAEEIMFTQITARYQPDGEEDDERGRSC